MKLVFISSPYRGDVKANIEHVKRYCVKADAHNLLPIAPHLYFTQFLNDTSIIGRATGMAMGLTLMQYCTEVWVFCNELTDGMIEELTEAKKLGLPLKFFTPNMEELTYENYIIHPELGPGYRRLIAEAFGDSFYYDAGCSGDCSKCARSGDGGTRNQDESDTINLGRGESGAEDGSIRRPLWRRVLHLK